MWKCEACNVRISVLIRAVNGNWAMTVDCKRRLKQSSAESLSSRGDEGSRPTAPGGCGNSRAQTSHWLLRNRHWRQTEISLSPSRPSDHHHSVTVLIRPTTSASLHQTDSDRCWSRQGVTDSTRLSHHITSQLKHLDGHKPSSHFFFAHPPLH